MPAGGRRSRPRPPGARRRAARDRSRRTGYARRALGTIAVLYAGVVTASRPVSGSNEYSGGGLRAGAEPSPAAIARAALEVIRASAEPRALGPLRHRVDAEQQPGRLAAVAGELALVDAEAAVEHPLRPGGRGAARRERGRRGDPDQRLLAEAELLGLVPALEAEARVPVEVAAVGPVAGEHAHQPLAQQPPGGAATAPPSRRGAPATYSRVKRGRDVRVLGRVGVLLARSPGRAAGS